MTVAVCVWASLLFASFGVCICLEDRGWSVMELFFLTSIGLIFEWCTCILYAILKYWLLYIMERFDWIDMLIGFVY